jgi:hypothetical protein
MQTLQPVTGKRVTWRHQNQPRIIQLLHTILDTICPPNVIKSFGGSNLTDDEVSNISSLRQTLTQNASTIATLLMEEIDDQQAPASSEEITTVIQELTTAKKRLQLLNDRPYYVRNTFQQYPRLAPNPPFPASSFSSRSSDGWPGLRRCIERCFSSCSISTRHGDTQTSAQI